MSCASREAVNVCWVGGDTESYIIRYKDSAGEPINLTGATAEMEIQKSFRDSAPVIPAKIATITPAEGLIEFNYSPTDTATLLGDAQKVRYVYDTQITLANSDVKTLTGGEINIRAGITD